MGGFCIQIYEILMAMFKERLSWKWNDQILNFDQIWNSLLIHEENSKEINI